MKFLLLCCFVLAVLARPNFPSSRFTGSQRHFVLKNQVTRDAENGEKVLDYDVTLSKKVVLLDQNKNVDAVICTKDTTTLKMIKGATIDLSADQILVGGDEWGCIHPEYNRPFAFYRKIIKFIGKNLDEYKYETKIVPVSEVFETANVKFMSTIPQEVTSTIPRGTVIAQAYPKEAAIEPTVYQAEDEVPKSRRDDKFTFTGIGQIYFTGETISFDYSYPNSLAGQEWDVCLKKKRFGIDKKIACGTITLSSYAKGSYSFKVKSSYESSNSYYIEFSRGLSFYESEDFGINPYTMLLTPTHADEFYRDNSIEVSWYASSAAKNKVVELSLMKKGLIDKSIQTWAVSLSEPKKVISINSLPKSAESGEYYFKMTYDCEFLDTFCDIKDFSDSFTLNRDYPGAKAISIESPKGGEVFKGTQNKVNIQWTSYSLSNSNTVKISICRDGYGIDPCPLKNLEVSNNGASSITVPSSWKGSSNYYVIISYNCKLFWCSHRESRRFAINYDPQFKFLSPTPTEDAMVSPSTLTVKWTKTSAATISDSSVVHVKLMKQFPLWELVHDGASKDVQVSAGQASFTISEGSMFPVRFMISYNCKFLGYFCQREYSPTFHMPLTYEKGWNYNKNTDRAQERKTLFKTDCKKCNKTSTDYFCKACNAVPNLKASVDVACTNCYVKSQIQLYDFTLNVNMLGVTAASMNVEGYAKANVDTLVQFDAAYKWAKEFQLAFYDIVPGGFSINVGPVKINLYCRVTLNATLEFSVEGSAYVETGADATYGFKVAVSKGGIKGDSKEINHELKEFNKHIPKINLKVDVVAKAGLKPAFDINVVDLLRAIVAIHPYFELKGSFKLPAFRPGNYPDSKSLAHLGLDCTRWPHYVEYDSRFHLDIYFVAVLFFKEFKSPVFHLLDKSLVSGCLFNASGPLAEQVYTVTTTLNALGLDQEGFKLAFLEDIASVMNADQTRFEITFPPVDKSNPLSAGTFNVKVQAFQTENQSEDINLKNLNSIIRNELSAFYQSSFGKKIKGKIGVYSP